MAGKLTVGERSAVDDRERLAREEEARSEMLGWAANAIQVLLDPRLSEEARHEVFALILKTHHDEPIGVDRQSELGLQQQLGRAAELITSIGESSQRIAESAVENAQHIEQHGLPR
jgi:hypothetical protein